jgi:hypothetical protein
MSFVYRTGKGSHIIADQGMPLTDLPWRDGLRIIANLRESPYMNDEKGVLVVGNVLLGKPDFRTYRHDYDQSSTYLYGAYVGKDDLRVVLGSEKEYLISCVKSKKEQIADRKNEIRKTNCAIRKLEKALGKI